MNDIANGFAALFTDEDDDESYDPSWLSTPPRHAVVNLSIANKPIATANRHITSEARGFLSQLAPKAKNHTFHFRTFGDKKARANQPLQSKPSGQFDSFEQKFRHLNAKGAGIFVVINEGGQTDAEITRIRAVFADTDGVPLEPLVAALTPHFVIASSPGKWHVYWLVEENFPLDQFTPIQAAIAAKFGTDSKIKNLSRVMRLPGFKHNKDNPFDVHFLTEYFKPTLPRYSLQQILHGLGLHATLGAHVASPASVVHMPADQRFADVEQMLRFISPWVDRDKWMTVLFALAHEFGEGGRDLAVRWSRGELWNEGDDEAI